MAEYEIDFEAVRLHDATFKRRQPTWSGQDILELSLNIAKSKWVIRKFNQLRVWPKGFYNAVKKARSLLKGLIRLSLFENFLTLCVLINTVVMAMERYDIDAETAATLEEMNLVFTWIFIVEMGIKLLAIGPKKYVSNVMNLLDGGVVLLSIFEMVLTATSSGGGAGNL